MLFTVMVIICVEQLLGMHIFSGIWVKALLTKCITPLSTESMTYVLVTAIIFK